MPKRALRLSAHLAVCALALAPLGCAGPATAGGATDAVLDAASDAAEDAAGDVALDAATDASADSGDGGGGGAGTWWTCPQATGADPTRAAGCEAPDDGSYGCKRAWKGLQVAGQTFTCNRCRGGDPLAQGRWRAIDFASEDPTVALPGDRREVLVIDGNTWHLRARAPDSGAGGAVVDVRVDGWYACADGAELKSERIIFSTTAVTPADGLGWYAPDVFTGHFLTSGPNLLSFGFHAGFEKDWIGDFIYCRIGSQIDGKACLDPFL